MNHPWISMDHDSFLLGDSGFHHRFGMFWRNEKDLNLKEVSILNYSTRVDESRVCIKWAEEPFLYNECVAMMKMAQKTYLWTILAIKKHKLQSNIHHCWIPMNIYIFQRKIMGLYAQKIARVRLFPSDNFSLSIPLVSKPRCQSF
jgi:hypothetical protein